VIYLERKRTLVTGAGRGIGREIALRLADAGCDVGICDIDQASASETAAQIEEKGRSSLAVTCDVSNAESVGALFKSFIKSFDGIDILVNNAGITRDALFIRMKEADWDAVLNVNLKSAYLCCKEAGRLMMKARSGKIINISSVIGLTGNAGQVNYAASKAGLIGLTKSLARELAGRNITVNAIAPGYIQTAMTERLPEEEREQFLSMIPLRRLGTPRDIADAALFLASPLSDYMTGQILTVDGGFVM
jgi:3-oxoacyl-[acyl-carrier protein] reductase